MIHVISMQKNIIPLHTKMQDHHLMYPNVHYKYHYVDIFHFKKLLMITMESYWPLTCMTP